MQAHNTRAALAASHDQEVAANQANWDGRGIPPITVYDPRCWQPIEHDSQRVHIFSVAASWKMAQAYELTRTGDEHAVKDAFSHPSVKLPIEAPTRWFESQTCFMAELTKNVISCGVELFTSLPSPTTWAPVGHTPRPLPSLAHPYEQGPQLPTAPQPDPEAAHHQPPPVDRQQPRRSDPPAVQQSRRSDPPAVQQPRRSDPPAVRQQPRRTSPRRASPRRTPSHRSGDRKGHPARRDPPPRREYETRKTSPLRQRRRASPDPIRLPAGHRSAWDTDEEKKNKRPAERTATSPAAKKASPASPPPSKGQVEIWKLKAQILDHQEQKLKSAAPPKSRAASPAKPDAEDPPTAVPSSDGTVTAMA